MHISTNLLALMALAATARAQDSVSLTNGLPGDAVDSRAVAEQINDYVVDLTSFRSSSGRTFALAPIAKASQQRNVAPVFFNGQFGAQALSRRVAANMPFLRAQYANWNAPGLGVNGDPTRNTVPGSVAPPAGVSFQFGFAASEFSDGDPSPTSLGAITGGIANFAPNRPSRLYVSRVVAGTNGATDGCNLAQFGMGAVDEDGAVHFRADNFGTIDCDGFSTVLGNNLFRVDMALRAAALNVISGSFPLGFDMPTTTRLLAGSATPHNVPNAVPRSIAGRPILIGSNFAVQYVFESIAGTAIAGGAGAHLVGFADHRGSVGYTSKLFPNLFPGAVNGTAGILAGASGSTGLRDGLAIFGVGPNGASVSPIARTLPAPAAGLDPEHPTWAPTASQQFDHYFSQTAFRGGSSQVALGTDQAGNLVAAGTVYYGFTSPSQTQSPFDNPRNYIAVARIDPLSGSTTWRAAAWTDATSGKSILQNGATVIGNLRPFSTGRGPCLSAPMIDSVGNVWFIGSFQRASNPGAVSVGLLRATWRVATDWWTETGAVSRTYHRVTLADGATLEVYFDHGTGAWMR